MTTSIVTFVEPDAEGFTPNGWVDPYPHNDGEHPCYLQCCEPEAYPQPITWNCQAEGCRTKNPRGFTARLRQPGECINCTPPIAPTTP